MFSKNNFIQSKIYLLTLFIMVFSAVISKAQLNPLWTVTGNTGTTDVNYIGTINPQPLIFKTHETERMRITPTGEVGINTSTPASKFNVKNGAVLFDGNTGNTPVNGAGTRLMWVPAKSAFRAGTAGGLNAWDDVNIGLYSVAFGISTKASGWFASAFGGGTTASGTSSTAFGYNNTASGHYSSVFGYTSTAQPYNSFVIGQYNIVSGNSNAWVAADPLFVIGNGLSPSARANAMTVLKNGNIGIGATTPVNNLDVVGRIAIGTGYAGTSTAPANGAIIQGNVGIGTPTPTQKLDVNGNISITGINSTLLFGQSSVLGGYVGHWGIEYDYTNGGLNFWKPWGSNNFGNYFLFIKDNGNVGIGTNLTDPSNNPYKLAVNGWVRAKEIVVETGWSDFVFEPTYQLLSLSELETFIKANKHLPEIPSATEISTNGLKVAEVQTLMMQKIEELTLYIIEQNKKIEQLQTKVNELEKEK